MYIANVQCRRTMKPEPQCLLPLVDLLHNQAAILLPMCLCMYAMQFKSNGKNKMDFKTEIKNKDEK